MFSPKPTIDINYSHTSTKVRKDIEDTICGIHGLYDYEVGGLSHTRRIRNTLLTLDIYVQDKRFLQMGIMTTQASSTGASAPLQPRPPRVIPFGTQDLQGLAVWETQPPPKGWVGQIPHTCYSARSCFSGWIGLTNIRRVTIYGNMKGIRVQYAYDGRDSFFGCVDGHDPADITVQEINSAKILGYASQPAHVDTDSTSIVIAPNQCEICLGVERIVVRPPHSPRGTPGRAWSLTLRAVSHRREWRTPATGVPALPAATGFCRASF